MITRRCTFPLLILSFGLSGYSSTGDAHDVKAVQSQYTRLSSELAKKIRDRDAERTAAKVRGFEAAAAADDAKKKEILNQFGIGGAGASGFEQIYIRGTLWPAKHKLKICFFDGSAAARRHVIGLFREITSPTNLTLDESAQDCVDNKADIQVRFNEIDCFSYYGKDSLDVIREDKNNTTMALCHLDGPSWSDRDNGTIRHEIMHALGAAHEHQHPESNCKNEFDLNAFRNPPLFDSDPAKNEQAIRVNIEEITKSYSKSDLAIIPYDPKSIMHYRLDSRYFKTPGSSCALLSDNNVLSDGDWSFLKKMYPK